MYTCRYSIIYIYIYAHNISATCCCSGYKPPQQETEGRVKLPVGRWRFQAHRLRQLWSRYREQNKQRNWMNFGHWTLWFYFFDEPKHQTRKGILDVKGGILLSFWRIFSWLVNIHAAIIMNGLADACCKLRFVVVLKIRIAQRPFGGCNLGFHHRKSSSKCQSLTVWPAKKSPSPKTKKVQTLPTIMLKGRWMLMLNFPGVSNDQKSKHWWWRSSTRFMIWVAHLPF